MKETVSEKLLAVLECGATTAINIAWAVSGGSKYHMAQRVRELAWGGKESFGEGVVREWKVEHAEYKSYHALLQRLQAEGLLATEGSGQRKIWKLTRKGIASLRTRRASREASASYTQAAGVTVISYDVPERLRKERAQLREILQMMGFEQAHKSVWFGQKRITKKFLERLRELHLLDCVHIFEITKTGTLKKVSEEKK